jgi:hypothetical protein
MRNWLAVILIFISIGAYSQFDKFFMDKTLRLDYFHSGNNEEDFYTFDVLIEEPFWGGSKTQLIDNFEYGKYYLKVFSLQNDSLIYSRGYATLFGEWQTTLEAKEIWRTFSETVVFPYPKDSVRVELYSRNWDGQFEKKFEYLVNPNDPFIRKERQLKYPAFEAKKSGDPANKVDIVILPEGYSQEEMGKFIADCNRFAEEIFNFSPFTENEDKFNVWGVLAPSEMSGADIPLDTVWQNTILNSSFYTFGSERYLMTSDNKSVRDLAANAPYDQIYILVNTDKYGGGAIFNHYNVSVMENGKSAQIIIHEFGHGFAALGDEYYDSSTGYDEFYNLKVEPYEANLTTLVDFDSKWKEMVDKKTPIPTPDKKKFYDKVGVFEGGGYIAKGVYRPMHDCLMKSFNDDIFCPVCSQAIQEIIDFYAE